eukprot:6492781-Amphidinium_carterae.5
MADQLFELSHVAEAAFEDEEAGGPVELRCGLCNRIATEAPLTLLQRGYFIVPKVWESLVCTRSFLDSVSCTIMKVQNLRNASANGSPKMQALLSCLPHDPAIDKKKKQEHVEVALKWAKRSRNGAAKGNQCLECVQVSRGFPGVAWETLVAKNGTDTSFAAQVSIARRNVQAASKVPAAASFRSSEVMEMTMFKDFLFMAVADFCKHYNINAKDVPGVEVVSIRNECGFIEQGVLFSEDSSPWRKVRLSWSAGTVLDSTLLPSDAIIRPNQPSEFQEWWNNDAVGTRPTGLRSKSRPPTLAALQELVEQEKKKKEEEKEKSKQDAEAQPDVKKEDAQLEQHRDSETEEEEDLVANLPALPSQKQAAESQTQKGGRKGKKGGGRGRGRGSTARGEGVPTSSDTKTAGVTTLITGKKQVWSSGALSTSATASQVSVPGRSRSPASSNPAVKSKSKLEKYVQAIDLERVLLDKKMGNEFAHADKVLQGAKNKGEDMLAAEILALEAHIKLAHAAESVSVSGILKLDKAERSKTLLQLWPKLETKPVQWLAAILLAFARDASLDTEEQVQNWVQAVLPAPTGAFFDWKEPRLGAIMTELGVESSRLFSKMTVKEKFVILMYKGGAAGAPLKLQQTSASLLAALMGEGVSAACRNDEFLSAAVEEVKLICTVLKAMATGDPDVAATSKIMSARTGWSLQISQAIDGVRMYGEKWARACTINSSLAEHGPVITTMIERLEAEKGSSAIETLEEAAGKLPTLTDLLPESASLNFGLRHTLVMSLVETSLGGRWPSSSWWCFGTRGVLGL